MIKQLFSRKWLLATFLVVAAALVMVRLGIWQLDRLDTRKAFNARVQAQLDQPVLDLQNLAVPDDLTSMEYRDAAVTGEYDHSQQVALRSQYWNGQLGVHLITPLIINGSDQAMLVDRGWIPEQDFESGDWSAFDEPGPVEVQGVLRGSLNQADFGGRTDPTPAPGQVLKAWFFVNIPAIAQQTGLALLPVYIQQSPDPTHTALPQRVPVELELSEGSHMGYALQWFAFALILCGGYLVYIRRQEQRQPMPDNQKPESAAQG